MATYSAEGWRAYRAKNSVRFAAYERKRREKRRAFVAGVPSVFVRDGKMRGASGFVEALRALLG